MTNLEHISLMLGKIQTGVERLREDFAEEKQLSKENRAIIHRRLDETVNRVAAIEHSVAITTNEIEELKADLRAHQRDVEPSIAEWKRMKAIGIGIGGLLAIGGLSIASMLAWAGEAFINWLRHLLKIG